MKISEIIDRILAYHPNIENYGSNRERDCDRYKCGDSDQECTGILVSIAAPVRIVEKAIELGCNLIIVHEPVFYTHADFTDWLVGDEVFDRKMELINKHGIVIWRDHDHIHRHKPDGIGQGVMMELGWQDYLISENRDKPNDFRLPQTTVRELACYLKEKLCMDTVRVIGNIDAVVSTVSFVGHVWDGDDAYQRKITKKVIDEGIDVVIPSECIDWTITSYMRDAGQLGLNKAMIQLGHMNREELGMKWAVNWISDLVDHQVPVTFHPAADMYQYV